MGDDRAERHEGRRPRQPFGRERGRQRLRRAELLPRRHPGEHGRDGEVEERANTERSEDADRQITRWIVRLFGGRRDRIEADVRKEDDRRGGDDSVPAVRSEALPRRSRARRKPVANVEEVDADGDEEDEHRELDRHQPGLTRDEISTPTNRIQVIARTDRRRGKVDDHRHAPQVRSRRQRLRRRVPPPRA